MTAPPAPHSFFRRVARASSSAPASGKPLITDSEILSLDRVIAEIEAVEPEAVCELAATLLASERLSAAGIGPSEEHFLAALEGVTPSLAHAA